MVKSLVVLAALLFTAEDARAKCGCASELLTPTVSEAAPRFVLATNCAPKTTPNLVLEDATGKRLPIQITATHMGHVTHMGPSAQYVVEPTGTLVPGKYALKFLQPDQHDTHALAIIGATSRPSPPSAPNPKVTSQKQTDWDCGPAREVVVDLGTSASLAFVELTDNKISVQTTGYVHVAGGAITIGHGMCGGPFKLVRGRNYLARITLVSPEHGTTSSSRTVSFTYAP